MPALRLSERKRFDAWVKKNGSDMALAARDVFTYMNKETSYLSLCFHGESSFGGPDLSERVEAATHPYNLGGFNALLVCPGVEIGPQPDRNDIIATVRSCKDDVFPKLFPNHNKALTHIICQYSPKIMVSKGFCLIL